MSSPNYPIIHPNYYNTQSGTTWADTTVTNIDEDIASADGLYVQTGQNATGYVRYRSSEGTPADFKYSLTATYNIRYNLINRSNDTESLYIQLWDNGFLAPLTDEMLVVTNPAAGWTNSGTVSFTGIQWNGTLNSSGWNYIGIQIRTAHTVSGAADNSYWQVDCIDINGTYEAAATTTLDSPSNGASYPSNWPTEVSFHGHDTNNDDLEFEIEIDTVNTFNSQQNITFDSYSGSLDTYTGILSYSGKKGGGQSFQASATGILTKAEVALVGGGSPIGTFCARLYSHSGAYGTSSVGDTLLAESESQKFQGYTGTFYFRDGYQLQSGTYYIIMIEAITDTFDDSVNYSGIWADMTSPTHSGNIVLRYSNDNWTYDGGKDARFTVSGVTPLIRATSDNDAGFTSGHPFSDAESITYTFQQSLSAGTYYWRVRTKDTTGFGSYSSWSSIYSFTLTEGSVSPSTSTSASPSTSISPSISISASPSTSPSASPSTSESASLSWSTGSICWGHITGVVEDTIKTFAGHWEGTGVIENSGNNERLALSSGDYMFSEVVNLGSSLIELDYNFYQSGDTIVFKYRHGATDADCQAASWTTYTGAFSCLGYIQVRVEYP